MGDILPLLAGSGPTGLIIGYLIWRELRQDKLSEKRIEADEKLAVSLALLTAAIKGGNG